MRMCQMNGEVPPNNETFQFKYCITRAKSHGAVVYRSHTENEPLFLGQKKKKYAKLTSFPHFDRRSFALRILVIFCMHFGSSSKNYFIFACEQEALSLMQTFSQQFVFFFLSHFLHSMIWVEMNKIALFKTVELKIGCRTTNSKEQVNFFCAISLKFNPKRGTLLLQSCDIAVQ